MIGRFARSSAANRSPWRPQILRLQRGHPLARGLVLYVPDMRPGLGQARDLANGGARLVDTLVPGRVAGPIGPAADFSVGNCIYGDTGWAHGLSYSSLTVMAHIRRSSVASGYSSVCGFGGFAPGTYECLSTPGTWGVYAAGQRAANTTLTTGVWYTLAARFVPGSVVEFFLDGRPDGTAATGGGFGTGFRIGYEGFSYGSPWITWIGVWNRLLGDAEIQSLSDQPWQMVEPDRVHPWFLPAAAPAGGFQAAWAARSTVTIQPGVAA